MQQQFINNSNQLNIFRAMIPPIFRSTRLCVTACGIMHPRCCRPIAWKRRNRKLLTQSNAPEDGRNHRTKHVELIGIINKLLLVHLVGVHIIYINDARSNKYQIYLKQFQNIPLLFKAMEL